MKKKTLIASAVALSVISASIGAFAASKITLIVNGTKVNTDVKNINGTSYVPLRAVSELLGANVGWDGKTSTITITKETPTTTTAPSKPSNTESKVTVTKAEYDKIQKGMSYEEIKAIIGGEGELTSEMGLPGEEGYTTSYTYNGVGEPGANAAFMFQNGQLYDKLQFGLK
jgi:hypothetical protein